MKNIQFYLIQSYYK